MTWHLDLAESPELEDQLTEHLVAHNLAASDAVRRRFEPDNLASRPVQAYAVDAAGTLLAGCSGRTEDVWQWLTVDTMWVDPEHRGLGLGRQVLVAVEEQARDRGCRWSKLNTWEFQAPGFYERCGYAVYAREVDYPPGHVNHLMRKDLCPAEVAATARRGSRNGVSRCPKRPAEVSATAPRSGCTGRGSGRSGASAIVGGWRS